MADRTRLLTLVHISDLHFGVPSAEDGAQPPADWRRNWSLFDGLLGHHKDALIHLTAFMKDIRRTDGDPAPLLVVTGDFTACGNAKEFKRARQFLESSYALGPYQVGLDVRDVLTRSIPGNHDHWPGTGAVKGKPTSALSKTFKTLPIRTVRRDLPSGQTLVLFGLNSDANVDPVGFDRRWARGRFASHLQALILDRTVGPPLPDEIRVLLLHHSPAHRPLVSWAPWALRIERDSRRALEAWIKQAGISVILTGHIHSGLGNVYSVTDRQTTWDVLEARCGTTTQYDRIPNNWAAKGTRRAGRLPMNSLIVHRLFKTGSRIDWEWEFFERDNAVFKSTGPLPGLTRRSIVVWPR